MIRIAMAFAVSGFVGLTLLFSELRWFRRLSLADRLEPYSAPARRRNRAGILSVASFREVIAPLSRTLGERLAPFVRSQ